MSYGQRLIADWPRDNSVTDRALPLFPAVSPIASPSAYTGGTTPLVPSALLAPPPDGEHTHNNNKDPLGTVIITQTASRTRSPVASAHVPAPSSRYVIGALGTGARHPCASSGLPDGRLQQAAHTMCSALCFADQMAGTCTWL